ncbi:MAG: hypothetical protein APR53_09040 [Methanoculleus sp. SDB]|nr:MAG: hypothetical protein APR53_09040 [Methanoculleus sp. SDB]
MNYHEREEAVSPVIGVILMVAITVILAAVIAVFVFGMAGDVQTTKVVAVTAKQMDTWVNITYQGGPDHSSVQSIQATNPSNGNVYFYDSGTASTHASTTTSTTPTVGCTMALANAGTTGQDQIIVTATFSDGTTQVIYDNLL